MYTHKNLMKLIRANAGLSQRQLAELLEVSKLTITKIETGSNSISKPIWRKMAKIMNVSLISLSPMVYEFDIDEMELSYIEKQLIKFGEKIQKSLIEKKAIRLREAYNLTQTTNA